MEKEAVTSKISPSDVYAEQAVLGSMLVDKDAIAKAIEVLKSGDFYRDDHKEIFSAMLDIYRPYFQYGD